MTILKFSEDFPDEKSCRVHFRAVREQAGISCKKCGCKQHYWLKGKWMWECSDCEFRTTLRSGTIMSHSNLPVRTWYLAMAFMSFSKKGLSAKELQRQLNHKYYEPIWAMMHKIREAMGNRDGRYELTDMIEFDEAYLGTETSEKEKKQLKRGKGSQKQQNVAVMAESVPLEAPETGKKSNYCRYFKMKVLPSHRSTAIDKVIRENLSEMSIVFSDKNPTYGNISDYVEVHITEKSDKETTVSTLKWVHMAISNAKRTLLGIYHKIKGKYLQNYLDEFCYKLNRRYFGEHLFDRLTVAVADDYRYDKR